MQTYINKEIAAILKDAPEKAILIEDKNGDQWVIQKDAVTGDTKIAKVPGGGLSPAMDVVVSEEALDFVKRALKHLNEAVYSNNPMAVLEKKLEDSRIELLHCDDTGDRSAPVIPFATGNGDEISSDTIYTAALYYPLEDGAEEASMDVEDSAPASLCQERAIANGEMEKERNRGIILNFIGVKEYVDIIAPAMARELKHKEKTISDYIGGRKKDKASDETIQYEVEEAIKVLIDQVVKDLPADDVPAKQ